MKTQPTHSFHSIFQGNDSWSNEWRGSKLCRAVGQWSTLALLESTLRKCMPRDAGSVRSFDENYWSSPASKGPILHLSLECLDFFRTDQLQDLHLKKRRVLFRLTFSLGCLHTDAPGSLVVSKREAKARAKARRERTRPGPLNQRGVCFVLLLLLRLLLLPAAYRSKLEQNLLQNSVAVACGHSAQMCSID